jgi:5-bromo-4-chloroindolyl phosphate hydrolysis protein
MNWRSRLLGFINFWPPLLFSGIKIVQLSKDYRYIKVRLKLRFWNANYVGTQFGGALFMMTDPFYMLMLLRNMPEYTVWDKAAHIYYLKPGRTNVFAEFMLTEEDLQGIRTTLEQQEKMVWIRRIPIKDATGEVIAEVEKVISIHKKTSVTRQ